MLSLSLRPYELFLISRYATLNACSNFKPTLYVSCLNKLSSGYAFTFHANVVQKRQTFETILTVIKIVIMIVINSTSNDYDSSIDLSRGIVVPYSILHRSHASSFASNSLCIDIGQKYRVFKKSVYFLNFNISAGNDRKILKFDMQATEGKHFMNIKKNLR